MAIGGVLGYRSRFLRAVEQILIDAHITFSMPLEGKAFPVFVGRRN